MKSDNGILTLGIEGGGTKTTWALVNAAGQVLKHGQSSKGNISHLMDEEILKNFQEIEKKAGQSMQIIGAGFAGCHLAPERARVRRLLQHVWPKVKNLVVGEDTQTAYGSAHGSKEGIIVICGTGSNVYGVKNGRAEKAGGWGFLFGDPGSGYDTARRALVAVFSAYDTDRVVCPLGQRFLQMTKKKALDQLVPHLVNSFDKTQVASLSLAVFEAAGAGDKMAQAVLQEGAVQLAQRVHWISDRLGMTKPAIGCIGSLLEKQEGYRALFTKAVQTKVKGAQVFVITTPGAVGAARMANPLLLAE
jgi:N-acetylmuramic acid 6-phosphate etherase